MDAFYFDGRSSRRHAARLDALPGCLSLTLPSGEQRRVPLADIRVSEPLGKAPRTLRFSGGDFCEAPQNAELLALLNTIGYRQSVAVRLQSRWRWAVFAFVFLALTTGAAHRWLLPWGAKIAAPHVSLSFMDRLSAEVIMMLDGQLLKKSRLDGARQKEISEGFKKLAVADPELASRQSYLRLYFRDFSQPNAFCLPGGQIVLLDKLVELSANNDEIIAVLAHEIGHFRERHAVRRLIQSSVVGVIAAVYFGDISSLLSGLTTILLELSYSRDMEREADDYAIAALRRQGISPIALANALKKLSAAHEKRDAAHENKEKRKDFRAIVSGWLSSHPGSDERIHRITTAASQAPEDSGK
ncbi:MAG: M48 family metallopeptidase [Candidatus Accumulibacter sp.]|jgi:Zn-dependent protease with chaperone function|nr:M48 family metallopeptidase [Accumulibacter sp.]